MQSVVRTGLVLVALGALSIGASACGSDDEGSGASTTAAGEPAGGDVVSAAQEQLAPYLELPTKLTVTEPLKDSPKPGERVFYIHCGQKPCDEIYSGISAAGQAVGWSTKRLTVDQSNPASINSAVLQAVQGGASIIMQSGNLEATFAQGLAEAKREDILFIDAQTGNEVGANGISARVGPTTEMMPLWGQMVANELIVDAGGKPNAAVVRVPTYDPIFQLGFDAVGGEFDRRCPDDCKLSEIKVSIQDFLKGQLTGRVVSYLQSNPDVKYLVFGFGAEEIGMLPALKQAGLDVKVTGFFPDPAQQLEIADGESLPWAAAPLAVEGWQMVDAAARLRQDMEVGDGRIPTWLITKDNLEDPTVYANAPVDYAEQFKQLWGLE